MPLVAPEPRLALESFNGMLLSVAKADSEKKPSGAGEWEPPDPTGKRTGRKRDLWRREKPGGGYEYSEAKPEGVEAAEEEDAGKKKPAKAALAQDLEGLSEGIKTQKISMDQAKRSSDAAMSRMGKKFRELKDEAKTPEQTQALNRLVEESTKFIDMRAGALQDDDREQMAEAVDMLQSMAASMGEFIEGIKGKEGEKEESPKEEKPDVPPEKAFIYERAALSTAPWEGQVENIEKGIKRPTVARDVPSTASRSLVYFDTSEGGARSVYKPEGFVPGIAYMRSGLLDPSVLPSEREVASFELDRLLGFGIVPPTFSKDGEVSKPEREAAVEAIMGHQEVTDSSKKEQKILRESLNELSDDDHVTGTAQHFVEGAQEAADMGGKDALMHRYDYDDNFKFNMQKLAVFDYIAGATDRTVANMMLSDDGDVYAIDNALNFTTTEKNPADLVGLMSLPVHIVESKSDGEVDKKIIDQLQRVKARDIKEAMEARGLGKEAVGMVARLQAIVEGGRLPKTNNLYDYYYANKANDALPIEKCLREELDPFLIMKAEGNGSKKIIDIWAGSPKKRRVVATVVSSGGRATVTKGKDTPLGDMLIKAGIVGPGMKHYTLADGDKFLEMLPLAFHGSFVQAIPRDK